MPPSTLSPTMSCARRSFCAPVSRGWRWNATSPTSTGSTESGRARRRVYALVRRRQTEVCATRTGMLGSMWKGILLVLAAGTALGQTPAFEVASVKPAAPLDRSQMLSGQMHVGMKVDAARVDIGSMSLAELIRVAYRVKAYQVSGPDWMASERFDVLAKLPEGASSGQVPEMLQALLAERFKLSVHRESKEHAVYALVVGKNGPKLKESAPDADAPAANDDVNPQVRLSGRGEN